MSSPRRLRVLGNSGSGKTSFARRLAAQMQLPHLELDSVQHRAGWVEAPVEEFQAEVRAFRDGSDAEADGWVIDGNYERKLGDVLADADCYVWLDYPRRVVMGRVVRRTVARVVDRQELWNGNREQWRNLLRRDPEENIVLWAWTRHGTYRARYAAAAAQSAVPWVRLRHPREAERWLRELAAASEGRS